MMLSSIPQERIRGTKRAKVARRLEQTMLNRWMLMVTRRRRDSAQTQFITPTREGSWMMNRKENHNTNKKDTTTNVDSKRVREGSTRTGHQRRFMKEETSLLINSPNNSNNIKRRRNVHTKMNRKKIIALKNKRAIMKEEEGTIKLIETDSTQMIEGTTAKIEIIHEIGTGAHLENVTEVDQEEEVVTTTTEGHTVHTGEPTAQPTDETTDQKVQEDKTIILMDTTDIQGERAETGMQKRGDWITKAENSLPNVQIAKANTE
jgi:hypothetical protein